MNLFLIIDDQWSLTINIFPSSFDFDMTSVSPPSLFHLAPGLESNHSVVDLEGWTQLESEAADDVLAVQQRIRKWARRPSRNLDLHRRVETIPASLKNCQRPNGDFVAITGPKHAQTARATPSYVAPDVVAARWTFRAKAH